MHLEFMSPHQDNNVTTTSSFIDFITPSSSFTLGASVAPSGKKLHLNVVDRENDIIEEIPEKRIQRQQAPRDEEVSSLTAASLLPERMHRKRNCLRLIEKRSTVMGMDATTDDTQQDRISGTAQPRLEKSKEKEATSNYQPEDWSDKLYQSFVAAVMNDGIKYASPSVLLEYMPSLRCPPELTSERVKSHLQKYRQGRIKEQDKFFEEYDQFVLDHQLHHPPAATAAPEHALSYLHENSRVVAGGALAAQVSLDVQRDYKVKCRKRKLQQHYSSNSRNSVEDVLHGSCSNGLRGDAVGDDVTGGGLFHGLHRVLFPKLTPKEETSPLGVSLNLAIGLLQNMEHCVMEQRQKQFFPPTAESWTTTSKPAPNDSRKCSRNNTQGSPSSVPSSGGSSSESASSYSESSIAAHGDVSVSEGSKQKKSSDFHDHDFRPPRYTTARLYTKQDVVSASSFSTTANDESTGTTYSTNPLPPPGLGPTFPPGLLRGMGGGLETSIALALTNVLGLVRGGGTARLVDAASGDEPVIQQTSACDPPKPSITQGPGSASSKTGRAADGTTSHDVLLLRTLTPPPPTLLLSVLHTTGAGGGVEGHRPRANSSAGDVEGFGHFFPIPIDAVMTVDEAPQGDIV